MRPKNKYFMKCFSKKAQPTTLVFAKAGRTKAVFQLLYFNLAPYRADE